MTGHRRIPSKIKHRLFTERSLIIEEEEKPYCSFVSMVWSYDMNIETIKVFQKSCSF